MSKTKIQKYDRLDVKKPEYLVLRTRLNGLRDFSAESPNETTLAFFAESSFPAESCFRFGKPLSAKRPAVLADGKDAPTVGRDFSRNHLGI